MERKKNREIFFSNEFSTFLDEPLVRRYCPAAGGLKLELSDNGGGVCFSGEAHGRTKRGSEKSTKLEQSSQKSAKSEDCPLMADDR